MPGDPYIFAPTDPGTWIRSVDGTWRRAPDDPRSCSLGERCPVCHPPATGAMGPCALDTECTLSAGHGDHCMRKDGRVILRKRPDAPLFAAPFTAVAAGIAMHGRWRVYFNKHGRADLPWCVAPDGGGWEIAVPSVLITTDATTAYQPKATPDDEDGRPSAWIAVEGKLVIAAGAGRASITATAEPEVRIP